jgi:signal transduction histidine kinase
VSVIMLTGYGTLMTAQQAMLGGANQYLRKPPDVDELIEAVRKQAHLAKLRRHQDNLTRNAEHLNAALKKEIEVNEPHVWQGRASVELVHDINNPLTVVIGYSTLLADEARALAQAGGDPERVKKLIEYASVVEKAAEYCHHLSENWRMASRKLKEFSKVDIVQIARDVRSVIFFGNVAIQVVGLDSAIIVGSKFELMRVFQNIFKNSIEAGSTDVTAEFSLSGNKVDITVTDNGGGMDEASIARAMHGGFSSKATGTGLGLNICRHLVGAHGGTFDISSVCGKSTTVKLGFPLSRD